MDDEKKDVENQDRYDVPDVAEIEDVSYGDTD